MEPEDAIRQLESKDLNYLIYEDPDGMTVILCGACKRISYSKGDIDFRYCGFCHKFHKETLCPM